MKSNIIGRNKEITILNNVLEDNRPHFMAIYGRRRVGKTYLIHQYFNQQNCVFMEVTGLKDGDLNAQLNIFKKALQSTFYPGLKLAPFEGWLEAFEQLTEAIIKTAKNKRIAIFLDELPWLATARSGLLQALDHYWNAYWGKRPKFILITCGSAASWMLDHLIQAKGGLYNRVTETILLEPYSLKETQHYIEALGIKTNQSQTLDLYMALGGIPHYLNHLKRNQSTQQMINSLCFKKQGFLLKEFDHLFSSLFEESAAHNEIIRLISKSRKGLTREQLVKQSNLLSTGGQLTKWISELSHAGFIQKYTPYPHSVRGLYYRLIDEYSLFYLTWIEPKKRMIETWNDGKNYWNTLRKTPQYNAWAGLTFETICYKHIHQIQQTLEIDEIPCEIGSWRYKSTKKPSESGAQIDLLFDRDDGVITLCEIKHSINQKEFIIDKSYNANLRNKMALFKKMTGSKKVLRLVMISTHGIKKNAYYRQIVDDVVTLEDLFH